MRALGGAGLAGVMLIMALAGCSAPDAEGRATGTAATQASGLAAGAAEPTTAALAQAAVGLAAQAAACASAPPAGYSGEALERLVGHARDWAKSVGSGASEGSTAGEPQQAAACVAADLDRAARRTQLVATDLANADPQAATLCWALEADWSQVINPQGPEDPGVGGVLQQAGDTLPDLVLAEDQAGFVEEYLAAQAAEPDRAKLAATAETHRLRADALAGQLAGQGGTDPRAAAYTLPKVESDQLIKDTAAQVEYALASQYAVVPDRDAAADLVRWQLVQAANWGYDLPAWPFSG